MALGPAPWDAKCKEYLRKTTDSEAQAAGGNLPITGWRCLFGARAAPSPRGTILARPAKGKPTTLRPKLRGATFRSLAGCVWDARMKGTPNDKTGF